MMWSVFVLFAITNAAYALHFLHPRAYVSYQRNAVLQPRLRLQNRGTAETSGILPVLLSEDKQSYFAVIEIGGINFRVALDTGSSDLWITSTACSTSNCKSVPRYPLDYQSPSFVPVNNNATAFNISYADGTVASGYVARETVQLSNLTVAGQAFGLVTQSNVTMNDQVSGVMGLGFPRLSVMSHSVENATPFFATLAQQGQLDYPIFGLSLTRNSSGSLSIGAVDASVVKNVSEIKWNEVMPFPPFGSEMNISSYLQWAIPFSGLSVNVTRITPLPTYPHATGNTSIALMDIGTAGLYGPYHDVSRLFELLDGSRLVDQGGQWVVPCDTTETITFSFGEQNYTLQPSDYLIGPAVGNPNLCLTWPRALPPSPDGIDWQIGSVFLRTVYSVFSYGINAKEPPMIGLYRLNNATITEESPDNVSSFLSSASATVATTLPNFPLSTPSPTAPPYVFNTSISAPIGEIVFSDLATSTYSPIVGIGFFNASAMPTISPTPTLATFILTNSAGMVTTSIETLTPSSVTLGVPPGWSRGTASCAPLFIVAVSCFLCISVSFISTANIV